MSNIKLTRGLEYMRTLLACSISLLALGSAYTHAAETTCPDAAQARQALSLIANKVTDRASAAMNGDAVQMEALQRSARIARALLQYREDCLPKKADWAGALNGDGNGAELFEKYANDIDALVKTGTALDRFQSAKRNLDESGPKFQALARQFVQIQEQRKPAKAPVIGRELPDQITDLLSSASKLSSDETVDPETVFLLGKRSNSIPQSIDEIPETFSSSRWGADAAKLTKLSADIRKEGTASLIAAGGMLGNVQQLVMAKRALADLRAIEPKAVADFAALIPQAPRQ